MDDYEVKKVFRIHDNTNGVAVTISPSADCPSYVILYGEPQYEHYFGKLRLELPAQYMRLIGQALIDCANSL